MFTAMLFKKKKKKLCVTHIYTQMDTQKGQCWRIHHLNDTFLDLQIYIYLN